jgi:hypothetical protein
LKTYSRITGENFLDLKKDRITKMQEAYRTPNHQDQKETPPDTSESKHSAHRTKKEL